MAPAYSTLAPSVGIGANDLTAVNGVDPDPDRRVDRILDEPDRAVTVERVQPARMAVASPGERDPVGPRDHDDGKSLLGFIDAVGCGGHHVGRDARPVIILE